jgi:hypothetical protein
MARVKERPQLRPHGSSEETVGSVSDKLQCRSLPRFREERDGGARVLCAREKGRIHAIGRARLCLSEKCKLVPCERNCQRRKGS